ncbi:hypothetical protein [Spirulina subsalsa]|uniref:hypothetical protein n=1 Tax=Spirulina subsalsa TaxID=54311 RepID=UPI0013DFE135|nr:hypothetical protein [Spirulina subsalsa]
MNQNLDFLYRQLLNWLQEPSDSPPPSPEVSGESELNPIEEAMTTDWDTVQLDPLDWEAENLNWASSELNEVTQTLEGFDMGEVPIVERRFNALLKRKFYAEIERKPPLFPWETELVDYAVEYSDEEPVVAATDSPQESLTRQIWLPQIAQLFPVSIPEDVLALLLDGCSEAMSSLRPSSAQMINAVKSLFPDYNRVLNEMVDRIRLSPSFAPSRLSKQEQQKQRQQLATLLPPDYAQATPEQQMALSLLVAKEILDTLTLSLSPRQRTVERLWDTQVGVVRLRVDYDPETAENEDGLSRPPIRARVQLPKGGSLTLQAHQESITAQRTYGGSLTVELSDWQLGQPYFLEIQLAEFRQIPLQFKIICTA